MKRALAFTFAALLLGVAGLAQISGSWSGELNLLPSTSLAYTKLVLTYTVAGFDLTTTVYADPSPSSVKFEISGPLGPAQLSGVMGFDPTAPAYAYTDLTATLDFAGVGLTSKVFHGVYDYGVSYFESTYALTWSDLCPDQTIGNTLMLYTFKASIDPVSLQVRFLDCCDGIEFFDFTLDLSDISLCCGIAYDFTLYFTKDGFEYVLFSVNPLFELCCGITVGVDVKFGVNYKEVTPTFSWGGIEGCVTVWGDLQKKGTDPRTGEWVGPEAGVEGWEFYGYKVTCELSECTSITFGTAFLKERMVGWYWDEEKQEWYKGDPWFDSGSPPAEWEFNNYEYTSDPQVAEALGLKDYFFAGIKGFEVDGEIVIEGIHIYDVLEYEVLKLSFCGPACCGGTWSVDVNLYWAEFWHYAAMLHDQIDGDGISFTEEAIHPTLFGLDRVAIETKVPIVENLSFTFGLSLFLFEVDITEYLLYFSTLPATVELYIGWDFEF